MKNCFSESRLFRRCVLILTTLAISSAFGCHSSEPTPPLPPQASVSHPLQQEIIEWDEYPGRLESPQIANVSARVSGIIEKAPFQEGSIVRQGEVLFVIDQRPFQADLKSKEADVLKASSQLRQLEARFARFEKLKGTNAISAEAYDEALASLQQAQSNMAVAESSRDISRLNFEWTKVVAPISGRVSRKLVTEGNLVTGGNGGATQLTTITSIDPMYCYANIPERAFLSYQSLKESKNHDGKIPVWIQLENEKEYRHQGVMDFVDNRINPTTGTVAIRGVFPNTNGQLTAGLFARMRIPGSDPYQALLIPDSAIGTNQDSRFVLVVGAEDKTEQRSVKLGALFNNLRAVSSGITTDDRIVVNGIQQFRAGTKINPQESPLSPAPIAAFTVKALKETLSPPENSRVLTTPSPVRN